MSALNGIRVVELSESVAGEYCGKLLADFGAEVVKVERPGRGSAARTLTPDRLFAYLNAHNRSVELDHPAVDDRVASAYAVIHDRESSPDLARRHPVLVVCSVRPFGHSAPPEWQNAKPLNVFHA